MTRRKAGIRLLPISLLLALLLCACGGREDVPMVDAQTLTDGVVAPGAKLEAEALVYLADGSVSRTASVPKKNVVGVVENAPDKTVKDVYTFAKDALEAGERVLIIYLDGFGWQRYQKALETGSIPNLAALAAQPAAAMYPTITPVNYAAMMTGASPAENGVTKRGIHSLSCDSIFDDVLAAGGSAAILEGDAQILNFSVPQELHPDLNGDGDTDDEVMESALAAVEQEYDLLFVHLHGIDDTSHAHGPNSPEAEAKIVQTDAWVGELLARWPGRVVVIADHGQHENDGNGDNEYADKRGIHGAFAASDILVPFLTR